MTRLAVAIMVSGLDQALAAAARAAEAGADLVEFRIDRFTADLAAVTALVERSALPCIVTCRLPGEGGQYEGKDLDRLAVYQAACAGARKPAYIDVELASSLRDKIDVGDVGLILSSHDFTTRPSDLYQRIEQMAADAKGRVVKIVWQSRSLRDNLEAFEIVQARHKPTVALCMGETGLMSRVLAKKFGALLTFAALDAQGGTAPGQPTIDQLKRLYRWDRLGPTTRVYGVIGFPVGHSMSPAIHNAGFEAVGFDGVYLPLPIPDDYLHFKATVGAMLDAKSLHFRGASVTIPHKQNLLKFVRESGGEIEPLAERIGAANTLTVRDDGSLFASNSDYAGALDAVCNAMKIQRDDLAGKRVAVIGAGGAARAIVAGFAQHGATVVIYNRTLDKAQQLVDEFRSEATGRIVAARLEKLCDSCCEIFINCTPIGMHPNVDATPIPSASDTPGWGENTVVFDTIYNPRETRLLREARAAGCTTVSGVDMFVGQGAAQFERWTGKKAPTQVFERVLAQALR